VNLFIAESLCSGKGFDESFSVIVEVVQQQKIVLHKLRYLPVFTVSGKHG
jgi:hypothetical protein